MQVQIMLEIQPHKSLQKANQNPSWFPGIEASKAGNQKYEKHVKPLCWGTHNFHTSFVIWNQIYVVKNIAKYLIFWQVKKEEKDTPRW